MAQAQRYGPNAAHEGGRRPALRTQGLLQAVGPLDQGVRVLELLDFLRPSGNVTTSS